MKKIKLYTKFVFHLLNISIIVLYLYPGSIYGWLLYGDLKKQPQLTPDFIFGQILFSSNHVYAFIVLSLIGIISYFEYKIRLLFIYLFTMSIFLEFTHLLIPQRSFQYQDMLGNFLGVLIVFIMFSLTKLFRKK